MVKYTVHLNPEPMNRIELACMLICHLSVRMSLLAIAWRIAVRYSFGIACAMASFHIAYKHTEMHIWREDGFAWCVCVRSMAGCLLIHKCSCGFLSNVEVDVGARCDFGRLQQFRLFHLLLAKIA